MPRNRRQKGSPPNGLPKAVQPELPIPDKEKQTLTDIYRTIRKMYGAKKGKRKR